MTWRVSEHGPTPAATAREGALIERARQLRREGDARGMLHALGAACRMDDSAAWLWALYGALLAQNGRAVAARRALEHAIELRRHAGDVPRARSTQAILDRVTVGHPAG